MSQANNKDWLSLSYTRHKLYQEIPNLPRNKGIRILEKWRHINKTDCVCNWVTKNAETRLKLLQLHWSFKSSKIYAMGWTVFPQIPNPTASYNVTLFADRAIEEVINSMSFLYMSGCLLFEESFITWHFKIFLLNFSFLRTQPIYVFVGSFFPQYLSFPSNLFCF